MRPVSLGDVHFVFAFLAALCLVVFTWTPLGRRVVAAVLALALLTGLGSVTEHALRHQPTPPATALHSIEALVALLLYGAAAVADLRGANRWVSLSLCAAGAVAIVLLFTSGMTMFFHPG